jgi:hypothetical protein
MVCLWLPCYSIYVVQVVPQLDNGPVRRGPASPESKKIILRVGPAPSLIYRKSGKIQL